MQKKKQDFRKLSTKRCIDCGQPLKKNLVDRNPDAVRDLVCHRIFTFKGNNVMILKRLKERQKKMKAKFAG